MMITIFSILCFFVLSHSTVNSTSIADKGKLIFAHVVSIICSNIQLHIEYIPFYL